MENILVENKITSSKNCTIKLGSMVKSPNTEMSLVVRRGCDAHGQVVYGLIANKENISYIQICINDIKEINSSNQEPNLSEHRKINNNFALRVTKETLLRYLSYVETEELLGNLIVLQEPLPEDEKIIKNFQQ